MKRHAISVYILLITLGLLTAWGWLSWRIYYAIHDLVKQEIQTRIQSTLEIVHENLEIWMAEHQRRITFWAQNPLIKAQTLQLLRLKNQPQRLKSAKTQNTLREWFAQLQRWQTYQGYFLVTPDGYTLSSEHSANAVGQNFIWKNQPEFFASLNQGQVSFSQPLWSDIPLPNAQNKPHAQAMTLFIGAPIRDQEQKIIGVLCFRIQIHQDLQNILDLGQRGKTSEAYLVDKKGRLASHSFYEAQLRTFGLLANHQDSALNFTLRDPGVNLTQGEKPPLPPEQWPLTHSAQALTQEKNGLSLEAYRDYRGVPVIGAWRWIPKLNLGLSFETNAAESYQDLWAFSQTLLIMSIMIGSLLLCSGLGFAFYHRAK